MMNRIKELRKNKGVTVKELSEIIGISQSMLSNYENGNSKPRNQETWEKLAEYFDVIPEYLLGYTTIRTKEERELCEKNIYYWRGTKELMESIRSKEHENGEKI